MTKPGLIQTGVSGDHVIDWQDEWILFHMDREAGPPEKYNGGGEYWKVRSDGSESRQVTHTCKNGIGKYNSEEVCYQKNGTTRWAKFVNGTDWIYFTAFSPTGVLGNEEYSFVRKADGTNPDAWQYCILLLQQLQLQRCSVHYQGETAVGQEETTQC